MLNILKKPAPPPSPNEARTWGEFRTLFAAIRKIADKKWSDDDRREIYIYIRESGEVSISMEVRKNKFEGRGMDPWAAAEDLANGSAAVANAVKAALAPK